MGYSKYEVISHRLSVHGQSNKFTLIDNFYRTQLILVYTLICIYIFYFSKPLLYTITLRRAAVSQGDTYMLLQVDKLLKVLNYYL